MCLGRWVQPGARHDEGEGLDQLRPPLGASGQVQLAQHLELILIRCLIGHKMAIRTCN